jgi:hypothetical protein
MGELGTPDPNGKALVRLSITGNHRRLLTASEIMTPYDTLLLGK